MATLGQQPLEFMSVSGVEVTSWAVEPTPTTSKSNSNHLLDEYFTVHICYYNSLTLDGERTGTFMLKREKTFKRLDVQFIVVDWLDKLKVDGRAYNCAIDVVVQSCEYLLDEVSDVDRRSLAMVVKINVGEEYEYDEDDLYM